MRTTREDILSRFNAIVGGSSGDEVLSLIEDITDTVTDEDTTELEALKTQVATLTQKCEDIDKSWRDKYKARFFEPLSPKVVDKVEPQIDEPTPEEIADEIVIEDLFED